MAQVGLHVRGFEDSRQRTQDGCCVRAGNELDNFGDKSGNSQHEKRCSSVGSNLGGTCAKALLCFRAARTRAGKQNGGLNNKSSDPGRFGTTFHVQSIGKNKPKADSEYFRTELDLNGCWKDEECDVRTNSYRSFARHAAGSLIVWRQGR